MTNKLIRFLEKLGIIENKNEIRAYWAVGKNCPNFGDMLTPYIIEKVSNSKVKICSRRCLKKYFTVTGSILGWTNKNAIIWGAGIITKDQKVKKPAEILAVRGPLTRDNLLRQGCSCPEIYGDAALILPLLFNPGTKKIYKLGIIPHYTDYEKIKRIVEDKSILVINLLNPVEKVIEDINSCENTISSSLHGIIVSHAYNIPSLWVKFSDNLMGDGTKFLDYFLSININPYQAFDFENHKEIKISEITYLINSRKESLPEKIDISGFMRVCPFKCKS